MHLIYGILEKPVPSLQAINISAVPRKGLQRVQLLKPEISIPRLPADLETMEIRAPDVVIPDQETTYWCYITELPDGFAKRHIIMVCGKVRWGWLLAGLLHCFLSSWSLQAFIIALLSFFMYSFLSHDASPAAVFSWEDVPAVAQPPSLSGLHQSV